MGAVVVVIQSIFCPPTISAPVSNNSSTASLSRTNPACTDMSRGELHCFQYQTTENKGTNYVFLMPAFVVVYIFRGAPKTLGAASSAIYLVGLQLHKAEILHDITIIIVCRMLSSFMDENRTVIIIMSKELLWVLYTRLLLERPGRRDGEEEPLPGWDAAVSCRQCDFSAPFEWKRNLHPHCYKARMHSALACCTITSLLCCWLAGAVAVLPQFIAKLQTTAFRVGQRTRERGSRQSPFSIDGVTGMFI